jgi:hypothetical protein
MKGVIALSLALVVISTVFAFAAEKSTSSAARKPATAGAFKCGWITHGDSIAGLLDDNCDPNKAFTVYAVGDGTHNYCCISKQ